MDRKIKFKSIDGEITVVTPKAGSRISTGLFDKNGVEIFDGDYIEIESIFGNRITVDKIVWYRCGFETQKGGQIPRETRIKVVSSIYSDPELLAKLNQE